MQRHLSAGAKKMQNLKTDAQYRRDFSDSTGDGSSFPGRRK